MAEQPEKIRGKHVRRKYVSPLMIAEPKTKTVKVTDADPSREGFTPIPEVAPPVERKEYKGFKVPPGLSLPQRRKWKQAINAREAGAGERQEARDDADTEALKQGIIDRTKGVGGVIKGAGEAIVEPFAKGRQWINRAARDPDVALEAGEFARRVSSGDRESRKQLAEGMSESIIEPLATAGDVGMAKYAAEEGKWGEAAMYGGLILIPSVVQILGKSMSKGWLKKAAEAGEEIPDEAAKKMNDLAKRVDEGKVTDDMQIRRELAGIEDTHKAEYMEMPPPPKARKEELEEILELDASGPSGYAGGGEYDADHPYVTSPEYKKMIDDAQKELNEIIRAERSGGGGKPPGGGSARSRIDRFASTPDAKVRLESKARERGLSVDQFLDELEEFEMDREISTRDAFYGDQESGGKLFQFGDRYIEAADVDDAIRLATNEDGFEHYMYQGVLRDGPPYNVNTDDDLRRLITEASPEESAKYFEIKRVNPRGGATHHPQPRSGGGEGYPNLMDDLRSDLRNTDPGPLVDKDQARFTIDRIAELDQWEETIRKTGKGQVKATINDPEAEMKTIAHWRRQIAKDYYKNKAVRSDQIRRYGGPDLDPYDSDDLDTLTPSQLKEKALHDERSRMLEERGYDDDFDAAGPSEAEIQEMIQTSKFGDPNELEMLKEDMRRIAGWKQGAQVESGRVRGSRTPGTPSASGKIPEGTSRAEPKGPRRERPKKKDE